MAKEIGKSIIGVSPCKSLPSRHRDSATRPSFVRSRYLPLAARLPALTRSIPLSLHQARRRWCFTVDRKNSLSIPSVCRSRPVVRPRLVSLRSTHLPTVGLPSAFAWLRHPWFAAARCCPAGCMVVAPLRWSPLPFAADHPLRLSGLPVGLIPATGGSPCLFVPPPDGRLVRPNAAHGRNPHHTSQS